MNVAGHYQYHWTKLMSLMIRVEAAPRTLVKRSRACRNADVEGQRSVANTTSYTDDFGHLPQTTLGVLIQPLGPGYVFQIHHTSCRHYQTRPTGELRRNNDRSKPSHIQSQYSGIANVKVSLLSIVIVNLDVICSCVPRDGRHDIYTTGDEITDVLTTRYVSNVSDGIKVIRDFPDTCTECRSDVVLGILLGVTAISLVRQPFPDIDVPSTKSDGTIMFQTERALGRFLVVV